MYIEHMTQKSTAGCAEECSIFLHDHMYNGEMCILYTIKPTFTISINADSRNIGTVFRLQHLEA